MSNLTRKASFEFGRGEVQELKLNLQPSGAIPADCELAFMQPAVVSAAMDLAHSLEHLLEDYPATRRLTTVVVEAETSAGIVTANVKINAKLDEAMTEKVKLGFKARMPSAVDTYLTAQSDMMLKQTFGTTSPLLSTLGFAFLR